MTQQTPSPSIYASYSGQVTATTSDTAKNQGMLFPILISGSGRSGSTLLMQLLGSDPRCVFQRTHSFEGRYLSYILQFAYLFDGKDLADSTEASRSLLGLFPMFLAKAGECDFVPSMKARDVFIDLWNRFSQSARREHESALFYAEKLPLSSMLPVLPIPHFTIFSFRDPRDVLLSANAFMKQKRVLGFGRKLGESDTQFALSIACSFAESFENYQARAAAENCCLVRYEDVVLDPLRAMAPVSIATGLQVQPNLADDLYTRHRTTNSVADSIYRWTKEGMAENLRACFDRNLRYELIQLGYPIDNKPQNQASYLDFGHPTHSVKASLIDVTGSGLVSQSDGGFSVSMPEHTVTTLTIEVDIDAESTPELWICTTGRGADYFRVHWDSGDSDTSAIQCLPLPVSDGEHYRVHRVNLQSHPLWRGKIKQIELSLAKGEGRAYHTQTQLLKWVRFVNVPMDQSSELEHAPSLDSNLLSQSPDSQLNLIREQDAMLKTMDQEVAHYQISLIEQNAAINLLSTELNKAVAVVGRLNKHILHVEGERDFFKTRWTRLTTMTAVKQLFDLRHDIKSTPWMARLIKKIKK